MELTKLSDEILREHDLCLTGRPSCRDRWGWYDLYRMALELEASRQGEQEEQEEQEATAEVHLDTLKALIFMQAKDTERTSASAYRVPDTIPDPDEASCADLEEWVYDLVTERNNLRHKLDLLQKSGGRP